jgi:acetylornithine deacetylase
VNIGLIGGGIEAYTIAPSCTLTCTVRYPPGTAETVLALLNETVGEVAGQDSWLTQHPPEWTTLSISAASHTDPDGPFVVAVLRSFGQVVATGPARSFTATCDARHLTALEAIPTIIFGPGELRMAHAVDEHIDVDQLLRASMMLVYLAATWCA